MGSMGPVASEGDSPIAGPSSQTNTTPVQPAKSRRGRKQNDNLPPSRSRDVQRAFRARRAERLAWLEARVVELEKENQELKGRLGIVDDPEPSEVSPTSQLSSPKPPHSAAANAGSSAQTTAPMPMPLPALSRPQSGSAPAWLPPNPAYMAHMHPPSPGQGDQGSADGQDAAVLADFVSGLTGGHAYASDRGNNSAGAGPIPPEFVPSRVAWNILAPFSSAARLPNGEENSSAPSPAALGGIIRGFVPGPGQAPGSYVRQDGDRVLVSIAAIEHIVGQARQQPRQQQPLPHPPHLPNYPYSYGSQPPMHSAYGHHQMQQQGQEEMQMFGGLSGFDGEANRM